jgi:hypothetical protein
VAFCLEQPTFVSVEDGVGHPLKETWELSWRNLMWIGSAPYRIADFIQKSSYFCEGADTRSERQDQAGGGAVGVELAGNSASQCGETKRISGNAQVCVAEIRKSG